MKKNRRLEKESPSLCFLVVVLKRLPVINGGAFDMGAFRLSWRKERPAGFIEKLGRFSKPAGRFQLK